MNVCAVRVHVGGMRGEEGACVRGACSQGGEGGSVCTVRVHVQGGQGGSELVCTVGEWGWRERMRMRVPRGARLAELGLQIRLHVRWEGPSLLAFYSRVNSSPCCPFFPHGLTACSQALRLQAVCKCAALLPGPQPGCSRVTVFCQS